MLEKNQQKQKRKDRPTWVGYYQRITPDKTKYSRKTKHRKSLVDSSVLLLYNIFVKKGGREMLKKLVKWWKKQDKKDKIAMILGGIAITYFIICWLNVITNNQSSGYNYPWWNFLASF
nr:MAG TPA: hypothetical protein [Caudoviricetes sp.]